MSNAPVSRRKWQTALTVLMLISVGGAALAAALAFGLADPPRAAILSLDTTAPASSNPLPAPPYTLEVTATSGGPADSAWGIWLGADEDSALNFLIDRQGYLSVEHGSERDWKQFIHLKPQTNVLYLNVDASGATTFRINGEIAWRGEIPSAANWGLAADGQPQLSQTRAQVFSAASSWRKR